LGNKGRNKVDGAMGVGGNGGIWPLLGCLALAFKHIDFHLEPSFGTGKLAV
jgi:hypothetical protein